MVAVWVTPYVWGAVTVSHTTVIRFFVLHYLLPLIIMAMVLAHLIYLHEDVSSPQGGVMSFMMFYGKDLVTVGLICFLILLFLCSPILYIDADN